ncbi:MAG: tetraacyldisaccharide 4'-kinase [Burkholderiales bacterium]|nr:tetraacyldisaccharide 4'-kinase [Burkholderiales bacterium]
MGPAATARPRRGASDSLQRIWAGRGAASTALLPLSWAYEAVIDVRRRLFREGALATHPLPVPVIVVGNLLVGGAGKTPAVIAICALLRREGRTPGIVSRGYGREESAVRAVGSESDAREVGDEPLLLARRTGAPVFVGSDRVAACHALLQAHPGVDVIVSDDGLQHLALGRDVEILVFDDRGAGNGRLLPAGPLRERLPSQTRPDQLVLYNASAASTPLAGFLGHRALSGVAALDAWWRGAPPSPTALEALRGKTVVAAAGLARPAPFFAMLREHGLEVVELPLPDHHDFRALPWPVTTGDVVISEKDAVKIDPTQRFGSRIWVATLDFSPEPAFEQALLALLPPAPPASLPDPHGNPPA